MKRLIKLIIFGIISTFFFSMNVFAYNPKDFIKNPEIISGKTKIFSYVSVSTIPSIVSYYVDLENNIPVFVNFDNDLLYIYNWTGSTLTSIPYYQENYKEMKLDWQFNGDEIISFVFSNASSFNIPFPVFKSYQSALDYFASGKYKADDMYSVPSGFKINADGDMEEIPVSEELGVPLEFRYYIPDTYKKGLINGNSLQDDFQASWSNKKDDLGYTVQIEYKGKYSYKENFLSPKKEVITDYHLVGSVFMDSKQWTEHQSNIDYNDGAPVYDDLKAKTGLHNVFLGTTYSLERLGGWMRIRYVKYSGRKIVSYGRWVEHQMTSDGSLTYTTDENGNKTTSDEYGDGVDYSNMKSNQELQSEKGTVASAKDTISEVKNISQTIGNVPSLLGHLLSFMPSEVFVLMALGVSMIVFIGILKALL